MSLRVLLADESSTIKKVFQIALQDYAVDVKSVDSGEDVLPVAKDFKPDIIFADILLQKHSGYDVSLDIKNSSDLNEIPIVLMWSGFMELDEKKVQDSKADGRIEKPFEVDQLRELVQKHVPKTQSQIISKYLKFPKLPEFESPDPAQKTDKEASVPAEGAPAIALGGETQSTEAIPMPPAQAAPSEVETEVDFTADVSDEGQWDMDSFNPIEEFQEEEMQTLSGATKTNTEALSVEDEVDEFQQVPLAQERPKPHLAPPKIQDDENDWVQKDISEFQMDESILEDDAPPAKYKVPTDKFKDSDLLVEMEQGSKKNAPAPVEKEKSDYLEVESLEEVDSFNLFEPPPNFVERRKRPAVNKKELEEVVAKQVESAIEKAISENAKKIIEEVVWKVVPEITKQAVEKELKRLLEEDDDL